MKVILVKDTDRGKKGSIVEVSPGFAKNFLFPRGMAVPADKENLERLRAQQSREEKQLELARESNLRLKAKLEKLQLNFKLKGKEGDISNSITTKQLLRVLAEKHDLNLPKYSFKSFRLREAGYHQIPFKLDQDITGELSCLIEIEGN